MRRNVKKALALVLAIVMLATLFAGCGSKDKVIKIGAVGPQTGASSNGGTDELKGKQMAVDEYNEAGGYNGIKVELLSEDDASEPSQSATAVTKLITQDDVVAIVGAHNSNCTLADMEVISKYGVPMLTPGSTAVSVTESGNEWITRVCPKDSLQAGALINYISENEDYSKIGVIHVNDDTGVSGNQALVEYGTAAGMEVFSESFGAEDTDMTAQLSALKADGVEALFIWCQYTPGALIMKQARAMDWDVDFYSYTGTIHQDTFELSDNAYVGCINSVPFIPSSDDPQVADFVTRYKEKYGTEPSQNSARAYDATMLLLNAIDQAGYEDAEKLQEAIRNTTDFDGLQGNITIDPATGEYQGDVMIVRAVEGGDWEYLASASSAS